MPTFHLDTVRTDDRCNDDEGDDFVNLSAATIEAVLALRELLGAQLRHGKPLTEKSMEITDDNGEVVGRVGISEALGWR
jgi:hypothetical protein